jgi:hypothetical protein
MRKQYPGNFKAKVADEKMGRTKDAQLSVHAACSKEHENQS